MGPTKSLTAYPLMSFWVALMSLALTFLRAASCESSVGSSYFPTGSWPYGGCMLAPLNHIFAYLWSSSSTTGDCINPANTGGIPNSYVFLHYAAVSLSICCVRVVPSALPGSYLSPVFARWNRIRIILSPVATIAWDPLKGLFFLSRKYR